VVDVGGSIGLLRDREFAALAGTAFARSQAYSTIIIALALYADLFGTTGTVEGLFGTGFALVQLLVVLPLGRRIDVGDSKRYLLAGFVLNIVVFAGFVFVENAVHIVFIRMVQGLGASLLWITGSTVIGEISPEDDRGQWLGAYNQFGSISSLAGDLVGGYLLFAHGFTLTYAVLSGVTLVAVRVHNDDDHPKRARVANRCEGAVWPPREDGLPVPGWDDGGWEGVIEAGTSRALGYATPAPPASPPAEIAWTERAADGVPDTAEAVADLGDPRPPRDAVTPPETGVPEETRAWLEGVAERATDGEATDADRDGVAALAARATRLREAVDE